MNPTPEPASVPHLVERMLSLGMSGDVILLAADTDDTPCLQDAALRHSAPHRKGPWTPDLPGLSVTDLTSEPPGERLQLLLRWSAARPQQPPDQRGPRFLIIQGPADGDAGHMNGITYHSRTAGVHLIITP